MIRLIDERVMEKLRDKTKEIDLEELVPLAVEWREERASRAKCPYCVKPIEKQATKCNHCLSEIEWFQFDGLYGPCKIGEAEEMERPIVIARAAFQAALEGKRASLKAAYDKKIEELEEKLCVKCSEHVFTFKSAELEKEIGPESLPKLEQLEESRRVYTRGGFKCNSCMQRDRRLGCLLVLLLILGLIGLMILGRE